MSYLNQYNLIKFVKTITSLIWDYLVPMPVVMRTSIVMFDLLVEFNKPVGYFALVRAQRSLGDYLGKAVDLVTKDALSDRIYPYIKKELKTVYGF